MPTIIAISSWTCASRVGLAAQLPAFFAENLSPIAIPTTVMGVRPGLGTHTGAIPLPPTDFEKLAQTALNAPSAAHARWATTGYFTSAEQVQISADLLSQWRNTTPNAQIAVDPVMGDAPAGLYVDKPVAEAIAKTLIPIADIILPNTWELEHLTGMDAGTPQNALAAARTLPAPCVVTSVTTPSSRSTDTRPNTPHIGAILVDQNTAWLAHTPMLTGHVHGAGDHLTAAFIAALHNGQSGQAALTQAVAVTHRGIQTALAQGSPDIIPSQNPLPQHARTDTHATVTERLA